MYFLSGNEVSDQYTLQCNQKLQFEKGVPVACHDYQIRPDEVCELMENTIEFEVRLSVTSTDRLRINSSQSRARVLIDDSRELECCKFCCMRFLYQSACRRSM